MFGESEEENSEEEERKKTMLNQVRPVEPGPIVVNT